MTLPPADDCSITDDAGLWRRFHRMHWVTDASSGGYRLSSAAFQNGNEDKSAMSVTIEAEAPPPAEYLARYPGFGLARLTAGACRLCDQGLARTPTPEDPAHAHVVGKKSSPVKSRLRDAAVPFLDPEGIAI